MQSPENTPPDPDALTKALDLELAQKRAQWERDRKRRSTWRALSVLFLFVIVAAALFVWFYLIPTMKRNHRASPEPRPPGQTH
jgi:hypothetical protein